jgi:hypothetical protein
VTGADILVLAGNNFFQVAVFCFQLRYPAFGFGKLVDKVFYHDAVVLDDARGILVLC